MFIIASLGVLSSGGYATTDYLRTTQIIKACKVNNDSYIQLELSAYMIVDITQGLSFFFFVIFVSCSYRECEGECLKKVCCSMRCHVGLILVVIFLTAIGLPVLGYYRDEEYRQNLSCKNDNSKHQIALAHAIVKGCVFFSIFVLCLVFAQIISSSAKKWEDDTCSLTGYGITLQENATDKEVQVYVNDKFLSFYDDYIKVGKDTEIERNALKRWFVIQYFVYLLTVLVEVVHIIRPSTINHQDPSDDKLDYLSTSFYLLFVMLAFFLPYYMAIWLNDLHDKYYKKMKKKFFKAKIGDHDFKPGLGSKNHDANIKKTLSWYYNATRGKPMTKISDFDFVPVILGVSIPLENPGYTFTILLSVMSIVFNFTAA